MLRSIPTVSICVIVPANAHIRNGVRRGATMVETAVIPTDRARSPFERYVITFEAVPPGQHPTRITPIARSSGREKTFTRIQAIVGIMVNWARQPTSISSGLLRIMPKSAVVRVNPIPNIITPSKGFIAFVLIWPRGAGIIKANIAVSSISAPIHWAMRLQICFILYGIVNFNGAKIIVKNNRGQPLVTLLLYFLKMLSTQLTVIVGQNPHLRNC